MHGRISLCFGGIEVENSSSFYVMAGIGVLIGIMHIMNQQDKEGLEWKELQRGGCNGYQRERIRAERHNFGGGRNGGGLVVPSISDLQFF